MTEKTKLQKDIEEAIARGIGGSPKREPQKYVDDPRSYMDKPVIRESKEGWTRYPLDYKGEMEFERMMKYESYDWSLLIRRREGHFIVTTLVKEEFVRGEVIANEFGEPAYLILSPEFSQPTRLLYTIKLKGEMFTNQQKRIWKNEERSKKIAALQSEVEELKKQHTQDLQKIGDLETANEELSRTLKSSVHERLKKLLSREKTTEE